MALKGSWRMALLLVLALVAAGCGGDDEPAIEEPTIGSVLASPADYEAVRLEGSASPLGAEGFVVDDGTASIVALGPRTPSLKVDQEPIVAIGRVAELEPYHVERVRREIRRNAEEVDAGALEEVDFEPGSPYLELNNVRLEDGS